MAQDHGYAPTETPRSDLLGFLMREHRNALVSYAEKMLGDRGLAEDIVQETLIRAWRHTDRLLTRDGSLRGWLFTVTRHLVVDWVRKPHIRKEVVGATYHDPPAMGEGLEAVHDAMVTRPSLRLLSPEHRAVLVHIYLCDRAIKETAALLGIPAGTVKSRQHKALRQLRRVFQPGAA